MTNAVVFLLVVPLTSVCCNELLLHCISEMTSHVTYSTSHIYMCQVTVIHCKCKFGKLSPSSVNIKYDRKLDAPLNCICPQNLKCL